MTDKSYRHIIFVIDRSGSMAAIRDGMQSGFLEYLREQQVVPLRTTASLWQFDSVVESVCSFESLSTLEPYRLIPRHMTALYDAVGVAVTTEGELLEKLPEAERPGTVLVLILSDGLENYSHEYTGPQVRAMLERQQAEYGWEIVYLGTNQDAFKESAKLGVHVNSTLSYDNTSTGTQQAFAATSSMSTRGTASGVYSYTAKEREQAEGGGTQLTGKTTHSQRGGRDERLEALLRADAAAVLDDDLDDEAGYDSAGPGWQGDT
jgi:hypothetical protein